VALAGEPDGTSSAIEQGLQHQNLLDETVKENESIKPTDFAPDLSYDFAA
jgi:hypothetical protein